MRARAPLEAARGGDREVRQFVELYDAERLVLCLVRGVSFVWLSKGMEIFTNNSSVDRRSLIEG